MLQEVPMRLIMDIDRANIIETCGTNFQAQREGHVRALVTFTLSWASNHASLDRFVAEQWLFLGFAGAAFKPEKLLRIAVAPVMLSLIRLPLSGKLQEHCSDEGLELKSCAMTLLPQHMLLQVIFTKSSVARKVLPGTATVHNAKGRAHTRQF